MNELSGYQAARHAPRRVELNGSFLVFSARTGLTGKGSDGSIPAVLAADWPGDGRVRFGSLAQRHQANAALIVIGRSSRATRVPSLGTRPPYFRRLAGCVVVSRMFSAAPMTSADDPTISGSGPTTMCLSLFG
jgi:hypothetical protein